MKPADLSSKFRGLAPVINEIHKRASECNVTVPEYLLQYPLQNETIDYVIVGVVSVDQLKITDNGNKKIDYHNFNRSLLKEDKLLDPRTWN